MLRKCNSLVLAVTFATFCPLVSDAAVVHHAAASSPKPTVKQAIKPVTHKAVKRSSSHYRYKTYFVPPPPAYMPSVLPELHRGVPSSQVADDDASDDAVRAENPYKKYVRTPGGDAPEPVQERKGVVTWSARRS